MWKLLRPLKWKLLTISNILTEKISSFLHKDVTYSCALCFFLQLMLMVRSWWILWDLEHGINPNPTCAYCQQNLAVTLHPETLTQGAAGSNIKLIFKSFDTLIMYNWGSSFPVLSKMTVIGVSHIIFKTVIFHSLHPPKHLIQRIQ